MAKILYIEDNETQLSIIKFLRLKYKHEIIWTKDVYTTNEELKNDFDIYIVDIMMKGDEKLFPSDGGNTNGKRTGLYIIKKIRESNPSSIIFTLSARKDISEELKELKVNAIFVKPTSPHEIHKTIIKELKQK